jgi:beta-galactosidase
MPNDSLKQLAVYLTLLTLAAALLLMQPAETVAQRRAAKEGRINKAFDSDWRFLKSDAQAGEKPEFDDSAWRRLDVPHDWSIEGPFDKNNPTGGAGGFLPAGVGWYRKRFTLPQSYKNRRVFIEFDGVMANSDVWINGFHLGKRPYGYIGFSYELTGHLNFGNDKPNVLAVRADNNAQPASRWYTGAGIYRHVRLIATNETHLEHWGTFITTPKVANDQATVHVQSTVINQSAAATNVSLQITIINPVGRVVQTVETTPQAIAAHQAADFQQALNVKAPQLWNLDQPFLYRAITRVRSGNTTLDDETTIFGIREFQFDAATGFWLNGRNFKIKGACLHHDASAFGAAVPLSAWRRRLEALRALGVNAIRTAHNPPAPEFLDLCDRMGFLVMDELFDAWTVAKKPYDYHLYFSEWSKLDLRDTVRRDRNHPSIIIYSAGNEIHDTPNGQLAREILTGLIADFHENDSTRPVTQALFRPNVSHDYDNGLADLLDVVGQNYREKEILAAHAQKPTRKILGTENTHDRNQWLAMRDNAPYSGQFIWAGIDYLGESRAWPNIADNFGLLDRTAMIKPLGMQRASWWSEKPVVIITRRVAPSPLAPTDPGYGTIAEESRPQVLLSDWTPRNVSTHEENVEIYSNCEQIELFLNGKSLGSKTLPADDAPRNWNVPFEAGMLRAVGMNKNIVVATSDLRTAGKPMAIVLTSERKSLAPKWDDVAYVKATIVDANGVVVPETGNLIKFKVAGAGRIVAVDSADNKSHESFQASERKAYQGHCFALLKATARRGRIRLVATSTGLIAGAISINAVAARYQ